VWLSASVPPVRLTVTSSLRCSLQRSSGDPTALRGTSSRSWADRRWRHYVRGWPRVGDLGVVAEDGPPVGAAWLRLLPEHERGYGFIDAETPELSTGVVPTHRGRGVGSLLLEALVGSAREQRHEALSLSVEAHNPARRLYERCGFQVVDTVDSSHTMLLFPLMLQLAIDYWDGVVRQATGAVRCQGQTLPAGENHDWPAGGRGARQRRPPDVDKAPDGAAARDGAS